MGRGNRRAVTIAAVLGLGAVALGVWAGPGTHRPGGRAMAAEGRQRHYFIAADTVDWDYAPSGRNLLTGEAFGETENVFVAQAPDRIGRVYEKSLYREYTDDTFRKLKPRPAKWEHLGMLGPMIEAEVGDTIVVTFRNNTPFPATMHPHGVLYDKDSEGAPYADGTSGGDKADDAVPTGGTHVYRWEVPERAGPAAGDPSSIMWMYHSHTDEVTDTYSGLIGPMVITRRGMAREDGSPKDVDRELVANFMVEDENQSLYLERNIKRFAPDAAKLEEGDEDFGESNLMHSINGYVYGNQPGLTMKEHETVRWYVMGMGTEVDMHTPHWHGNVVTMGGHGMRADVVSLLPGTMLHADMQPDAEGAWLFHCHVNDHIIAGMQSIYHVTD
jgi:FtsP/CotA-like multicopper oxidase with cupredoxin domain